MSNNNFEIKGLEEIIESLDKTQNEFPKLLQKLIIIHGGELQAGAMRRTPVDTGQLRRSWKLEKREFYVRVYNNTHYAIHVEYGHRTKGGKKYVEGRYMLKKSFEKQIIDFEKDLKELLEDFGFR